MFQEIEGMIQKVSTGEVDAGSVGNAASQHVNSMDVNELKQHVQTAATNAQQNGNTGLAQQLFDLVAQHGSNPEELKGEVINVITNNPQILQQFAPAFAKSILARL